MSDRLCETVRPQSYTLRYRLDFNRFRFEGTQDTVLTTTEPASMVRMHCEDLTIAELSLKSQETDVPVTYEQTGDELHITPEQHLQPGAYRLGVGFSGALNDELSGFYRSRYTDSRGREAFLATTQFEAPYARKAFPCFDEPDFKATFTVTLDIPAHMIAVSNMPAESEAVADGRKTVGFAPTPPMSTYLLYMGAGDFDWIEEIRGKRSIRVYGVNGKSGQGTFALEVAADTLEYFEHYTGIEYPLPKLDLIAIPDFAAGAMENWGAVTFREVLLYTDEAATSLRIKKRIAEVVAHELWHQWSGNLVTMKWWDDLWLNEAFATYQAFHAVDHFFPEWHIWDDFIDGDTKAAFDMDMLSSTHPIAVPVHTANEIEEIFDHISYGKGGSVLRMIEGYIGNDAFRKGVAAYLRDFMYGSAVAEDLWNTLERNSGQPVKDILIAWVKKPGFPLLRVTKKGSALRVCQQRFSAAVPVQDTLWPVPLTWLSSGATNEFLFDSRACEIAAPCNGIIKCNAGQTGFYRTLYESEFYAGLSHAVHSKQLGEYDRWGILNDLWACVFAGHARLANLLTIMESYHAEEELFVLRELASQCADISLHLRLDQEEERLFARYRAPFTAALDRLGWEPKPDEHPRDRQLRPLAVGFLIRAGDRGVTKRARAAAQAYLDGGSIDPDLRAACLQAVARTRSRELFDSVRKTYERKEAAEEKVALLGALGDFADPSLLERYANYILTDAVRRQDLRTAFARMGQNPACSAFFFDWAKANWEILYSLRKSHFVYMGLLRTLITTAPDRSNLQQIREFLAETGDGYEKTRANSFEKAELGIDFREREWGEV